MTLAVSGRHKISQHTKVFVCNVNLMFGCLFIFIYVLISVCVCVCACVHVCDVSVNANEEVSPHMCEGQGRDSFH